MAVLRSGGIFSRKYLARYELIYLTLAQVDLTVNVIFYFMVVYTVYVCLCGKRKS